MVQKFAIALEYDGKNAPVVTARGHHELADEILELARQADIPVHEDEELSLLLAQLDLGDHIPEALYFVIAEILSFAYKLSGKHKDFMDNL
ncbi:MAG: flagellar biosynthesis protein [Urechidicola sp.]|jgi:flagellar biosynthesis protein